MFFDAAQQSLDTALIKNTHQIERTVWERVARQQFVGYRVSGSGRLAGLLLSKYGKHGLDLGFGLGIDVGWQGVIDYPLWQQGQITGGQYAGRLGVTAAGSAFSWGVGIGLGWAVTTAFAPEVTVVAGVVFVSGVVTNIVYDQVAAPWINEKAGFEPGTTPFWERIFE